MLVYVIVGQMRESYEGEYAPELLDVISEYGNDDNPEYLIKKMDEYKKQEQWENVIVVSFEVDQDALAKLLRPENNIKVDLIGEVVPEK